MVYEQYEMKNSVIGNYVDDDNQIKFYDDFMDNEAVNTVKINPEKLTIESDLKTKIVFRKKEDFDIYMKYHKNTFRANGFKELI